jgi:hypothetical protein
MTHMLQEEEEQAERKLNLWTSKHQILINEEDKSQVDSRLLNYVVAPTG